MEIWKEIEGYETLYKVSDQGNVFSIRRNKELIKTDHCKGYFKVKLCDFAGNVKTMKVHRLVALAFLIKNENKPQVNHKDGNKKNNKVTNLEWVNNQENSHHAAKNGLLGDVKGNKNGMAILNEEIVKEIRFEYANNIANTVELAKKYKISRPAISMIINRKTWTHI
jgi:hypothetical protein